MPESLTRVERERELSLAMQACADAWLHGRTAEADDELDLAIRLARELRDVRLPLLQGVAVTGPDGRARLRPDVVRGEMQRIGLDSTKTISTMAGAPPADGARHPEEGTSPPQVSGRACARCGETTRAADPRYCEACGEPFDHEDPS